MFFKTDPMMVAGYGVWEIDGKPVTNRDGEPVEYVQLIDLEADEIHRFSLRDVPPKGRPEPMTYARLTCEARTAQKGREDGSVTSRLQVRVTALESASKPAGSSASTTPPAS